MSTFMSRRRDLGRCTNSPQLPLVDRRPHARTGRADGGRAPLGSVRRCRCSTVGWSRTSASTTPPARRRFGTSSMRSSASCRTTRASIGGPASSHGSAPRPMTKRTRRSRALWAPTRRPIRLSSARTRPKPSTSSPSAIRSAAQRGSLDGDGAPLERSALARSRNGGSRKR